MILWKVTRARHPDQLKAIVNSFPHLRDLVGEMALVQGCMIDVKHFIYAPFRMALWRPDDKEYLYLHILKRILIDIFYEE